ncbi:MAG: hypothetical protein KAR42_09810 [candidate division Zixibacteria bacterium]|nr:hypothetical protein [candidate division Zixibacteria bacterium]
MSLLKIILTILFLCSLFSSVNSLSIDSLFTYTSEDEVFLYRSAPGYLSLWMRNGSVTCIDTTGNIKYEYDSLLFTTKVQGDMMGSFCYMYPLQNKRIVYRKSDYTEREQEIYKAKIKTKFEIWDLEPSKLIFTDELPGNVWMVRVQDSLNLVVAVNSLPSNVSLRLYRLNTGELIWKKPMYSSLNKPFFCDNYLYNISIKDISSYQLDSLGKIVDSAKMEYSPVESIYQFEENHSGRKTLTIFGEVERADFGHIRFISNKKFTHSDFIGPNPDTVHGLNYSEAFKIGDSKLLINYHDTDSLALLDFETGEITYFVKPEQIRLNNHITRISHDIFAIGTEEKRFGKTIFVFRLNLPQLQQ